MNIFGLHIGKALKEKAVSFFPFLNTNGFNSLNGTENPFDAQNLHAFKRSLYLFIGVSMIRESASGIPLELYRVIDKDGNTEEIYDDPVLDLLGKPNDRQTQKEFWKLAISYYLLAGETFWYLEKATPTSFPTAMVNLRPDYVTVLLSPDRRTIVAYEFNQSDGTTVKLPPDSVLHIKNIDPTNPLRGIGVVRPATHRIVTEEEAAKYQADTFKSQGIPKLAVMTDLELDEEKGRDARENWKKIYGDGDVPAGFFGEDVKDIKTLSTAPTEMGAIESMNFLRDDILAALHVPKAMVTSDDVNLANSKTARINYLKEAVLPVLDTFLDILNNKFLNVGEADLFLSYDSPVNEDREMLRDEAVDLKDAGIISLNEARAIVNYEAVDGGDTIQESSRVQLNIGDRAKAVRLRTAALRFVKRRKVLYRRFVAVEAVRDMLIAEKKKAVKRGRNSVFHTQAMKEAYIKAFNDDIDRRAAGFSDTLDVYNAGLMDRIINGQKTNGLNSSSLFDASYEISTAKDIFNPLMAEMYAKTGQDVMDNIANGFSNKASERFYTPDEVLQMLEHRAEFFITSMLDTDFKQLSKLIAQGMTDGKSVDEIARAIRGYFDDMSVARSKTIARTETGRLVSMATQEAYHQSEFVTGKEWLTAGDDKVRPEHQMNAGVIVSTDEAFPDGEHFPGESSINCRCALAPAV